MWNMMINRVKYFLGIHPAVPGEDDAPPDRGTVISRATGNAGGSFVGRVSGDDEGAVGQSGAEARSLDRQGAGE